MTAAIGTSSKPIPGGRRPWLPWFLVVLSILAGAILYRSITLHVLTPLSKKVELPVPLSFFPFAVGGWTGVDSPLTPEVERIADNDAYLNRIYTNSRSGEVANMYIAYSGRPRTMVGHRPQICYVNAGWVCDETAPQILTLPDGRSLACLVHRFHKANTTFGEVFVLNYYVLNGVITNDEDRFAGVSWRLPNIDGNPARYVAQIQISSRSEASVKGLAIETAGHVLDFLPDEKGSVKAAEYVTTEFGEALSNDEESS